MPQSNQKNNTWLVCLGILAYLFLVSLGFYLLYISRTGESILSPWQTIHPIFIYVFFAATLLLGLMIVFPRLKSSNLLILLILHSLLLHSYLPLTHDLLYGADQWRHIANEEQILQGNWPNKPVLSDGTQDGWNAGDLAYGLFWVVEAGMAKVTMLDLITINKWLIPILWSVAFPVFLYWIGRKIFWGGVSNPPYEGGSGGCELPRVIDSHSIETSNGTHDPTPPWATPLKGGFDDRAPLFLVWLSFLPFALQAAGSFTLPVNFGFLIWLAEMLLIFRYLQNPERKRLYILLLIGVVSIFNYTLFFVLYWVGLWGAMFLVWYGRRRGVLSRRNGIPSILGSEGAGIYAQQSHGQGHNESPDKPTDRQGVYQYAPTVMVIVIAFVLPLAEILTGYSHFDPNINWLSQIKQLIGNFTALYLAAGPRPHDIATGNIIFNQVPIYAFVENIFTAWRWWLVPFMIGLIVLVKVGWWKMWKSGEVVKRWWCIFAVGIFLSYIISRYFLVGENVLTRRLDGVVGLFFVVFAAAGMEYLWNKFFSEKKKLFYCSIVLLLVIFSTATAASYSLGADTQTVSGDEYRAMKYVWEQEKGSTKLCVIAGTYPLLALEAISQKQVIGGGLPIDEHFAQPEQERFLSNLKRGMGTVYETSHEAMQLTKTDHCYLVGSFGGEPPHDLDDYIGVIKRFGNVSVWEYIKDWNWNKNFHQ